MNYFDEEFTIGKQPCNDFKQQIECNEYAEWGNIHECYKCGGKVSLCENCYYDHHENGYETCKPINKQEAV